MPLDEILQISSLFVNNPLYNKGCITYADDFVENEGFPNGDHPHGGKWFAA